MWLLYFGHMARPLHRATATPAPAPAAGTADLGEIRSRIASGHTEGHYYVALLGLRSYEPLALDRQVRKGLGFSSFLRFQRNTRLSAPDVAELIRIPARTLTRRKAEGRLAPDESDRLVRASRIFGRAMELFEGDREAARTWLTKPQAALGGHVPLQLARTDVGAGEVEGLIGRMEYGIPS
jgi:putative toxin-antitoxin system antitoxin component (TIGR02293 family)